MQLLKEPDWSCSCTHSNTMYIFYMLQHILVCTSDC